MLSLAQGERVSCLGPLGRGFDLAPGPATVALISGGLGVAPMPLAARDARAAGMQVTWVHGARSADELCIESGGDAVIMATDDGSRWIRGQQRWQAAPDADVVLACGPNHMLAAVARRWPDAQVAGRDLHGLRDGRVPGLRGATHPRRV